MSFEQLIVFLLLVGIPLIRALRAALEKRREASHPARASDAGEPALDVPSLEPLGPWPPIALPPVHPPSAPAPPPPPEPAPRALAPVREESARRAPPSRHTSRRPTAMIPRDRESLRRAMVMMTVFGPPRSLER
jgi:hypothetical protein